MVAAQVPIVHPSVGNPGGGANPAAPKFRRQPSVASPLTFNFQPVGRLGEMLAGGLGPDEQQMGQRVITGFEHAADLWRAHLRDPITINVEVDFTAQGNRGLGSALADDRVFLYADVAAALADDISPYSAADATAVSQLQEGPMEFITNDAGQAGAPRIRDNDRSGNNFALDLARANAKALGLIPPHDPQRDLQLVFSDLSDFVAAGIQIVAVAADGVGADEYDFVAVAAHELAHGMGFLSGVDIVDLFSDPNGPMGPSMVGSSTDLNVFAVFTVLDLFRYTNDSVSRLNQPSGGLNDLAFGQPSPDDRPYFSIDGGETILTTFATGRFNGDGHQASHWQDDLAIGLLDPTTFRGEVGMVTSLDVLALDVIGFDPVPEPATWWILMMVFGAAVGRRRR